MNLIQEIKNLMVLKGLSSDDISRYVGCTEKTIYRWLNGESTPTFLYRKSIEKAIKKMKKLPALYGEKTFWDLLQEAKKIWPKIKHLLTEKEKQGLLNIQNNRKFPTAKAMMEVYIQKLKELVRKYGIDIKKVLGDNKQD